MMGILAEGVAISPADAHIGLAFEQGDTERTRRPPALQEFRPRPRLEDDARRALERAPNHQFTVGSPRDGRRLPRTDVISGVFGHEPSSPSPSPGPVTRP